MRRREHPRRVVILLLPCPRRRLRPPRLVLLVQLPRRARAEVLRPFPGSESRGMRPFHRHLAEDTRKGRRDARAIGVIAEDLHVDPSLLALSSGGGSDGLDERCNLRGIGEASGVIRRIRARWVADDADVVLHGQHVDPAWDHRQHLCPEGAYIRRTPTGVDAGEPKARSDDTPRSAVVHRLVGRFQAAVDEVTEERPARAANPRLVVYLVRVIKPSPGGGAEPPSQPRKLAHLRSHRR